MGARIRVVLVCEVCGDRNYQTSRSATPGATALKVKKFCRRCNAHTVHHESK